MTGNMERRITLAALGCAAIALWTAGAGAEEVDRGAYLKGRFAVDTSDLGRATTFMGEALSADPENHELRERLFHLLLGEGRIDEATALARQMEADGADTALSHLARAMEAAHAGAWDRASGELAAVDPSGLNQLLLPLLKAWVTAAQGDVDGALAALEPLRTEAGFAPLATFHEGLILEYAKRWEPARAAFDRAGEEMKQRSIRMVLGLGGFYERIGEPERARAVYQSFLDENPDSELLDPTFERMASGELPEPLAAGPAEGMAEALFDFASALQRERADRLALMYLRLAMYLHPDFSVGRLLAADILEDLGRQADAITELDQVPDGSRFAWLADLAGSANLLSLDRREEAMARLRALADRYPHRSEPLIRLGDALRGMERFDDAVAAYDEALGRIGTVERRHWRVLYARGIALERAQQWERAEKDLLTALELEPDQPYVLNYLGYSWVDKGMHLEQAKAMIEKAVDLRPRDGYIVDSLGWVLYRLGEYDEAAGQLERAVELRPQDPVINDHLGDAYWRVGRKAEARFQWRRALSLEPEPGDAAAIEEKLLRGLPAKTERSAS